MISRALLYATCLSAFIFVTESARADQTNKAPYTIDLATTLQLAGAQNLDVQIARERLKEAEANHSSALEQFLPSISPGIGFHRRDGVAQAVPSGVISDAHFQSYTPGATLAAQITFGDALYNTLSAKQLVKASDQALQAQRQDSALAAAQAYFDLAKAKALVDVVTQAIGISRSYQEQLHIAVESGVAFKGDELRVQTQTEHYEITLQQALEQQRVSAATLAQVLHLDATVELLPRESELVPLTLISTNLALETLVTQALKTRPELKQGDSLVAAAKETQNGAMYGPLIPSLGAQVFGGGLGGGPDGGHDTFAGEADYTVGLSWKIGPGGLFDRGRIHTSEARLAITRLSNLKLKDSITAEVVVNLAKMRSTAAQIDLAERNLETANQMLRLTRERKQFGVGAVLEDIESQQAINQAQSDYFTAIAEYNKAQYRLNRAVGSSFGETEAEGGRASKR
jgi:outer membrane protein TolC